MPALPQKFGTKIAVVHIAPEAPRGVQWGRR